MGSSFFCYVMLIPAILTLSESLTGKIALGSDLSASSGLSWVSENGTFALGFTSSSSEDDLILAIRYAGLPDDQTTVWSPNRDSPVSRDAVVRLDQTGNLQLLDRDAPIWASNTTGLGVEFVVLSDTGNLLLCTANSSQPVAWESFKHPSDTLLPGQPLTASLELTSSKSQFGYYCLKMLQQQTSLSLALTYILPEVNSTNTNFSYWSSPQISNATGDVVAMLDQFGSFAITYGRSSAGMVYVHKNDSGNSSLSVLRRITIEEDGNLHLYEWNSSRDGKGGWESQWLAVSNPCQVAGICGSGLCTLDGSSEGTKCRNLSMLMPSMANSGDCRAGRKMEAFPQIRYYFSGDSTIANYSNLSMASECSAYCLSDCDCVASVYEIVEDETYCWSLSSMVFGGLQDPSSTLYVKVGENETNGVSGKGSSDGSTSSSSRRTKIILPLLFCLCVLLLFICLLLRFAAKRKKLQERLVTSYLSLPGAPSHFNYHDLQIATCNFSSLLGSGGFGSVYKGTLRDGTLVAVKKLDRLLPHGEKEFITEVTTIGAMHHMNLVTLCGFCSERSHRLLVYEYMSNGSLDKWIFPSQNRQTQLLNWKTRYEIAVAIARGIAYFHEQCRNRIIHCDIKPENILLGEDFCPKVSDFGLAKLMSREHSRVVTMVRGTRGYLAPEWISNRPITVKADVYSYGMLLLEIAGGRRNLDMSRDADEFFYPGFAFKELKNGTPARAADKRLKGGVQEEELSRALRAAFWCIQEEANTRPSMGELVRMLEGSAEIPEPPVPQAVQEMEEEGLQTVYNAMKRGLLHEPLSSSFVIDSRGGSKATCSYSTMSPR